MWVLAQNSDGVAQDGRPEQVRGWGGVWCVGRSVIERRGDTVGTGSEGGWHVGGRFWRWRGWRCGYADTTREWLDVAGFRVMVDRRVPS